MSSLLSLALYGLILLEFAYGAIYLDQWAAQIDGGVQVAKDLAERHGFSYVNQIMPDHYLFRHKRVVKRSVYASPHHSTSLSKEPQVKWLEQQVAKRRVKREGLFNDPKWPRMWYLRRGSHLDMNVKRAWSSGISGKGVVVTILDDGIEKDHPDLKKNYDPLASYDVNNHDPDPQPRYDYSNENRHGTRCAGEVAAEADNGICSVGVAYGASIGGVRMLDGDVTDAVEAHSLSLNTQHIDIYSASWGPDDDGRTVDGPAALAKKAFYDGINKGRGGKGSIFVWASGNGGRDRDNCNCDGYTNSIYTLSISSATENGNIPWYSEACSSTLATTYSSGSGGERQIVTTDLRKGCTETHTGTSASAPLAAGICALALQANPRLTWRDMQHIVVRTARTANLRAADWVTNGVGRRVSHSFGYGLMDASAMVDLAKNWTNVPPQHMCEIHSMDAAKHIPVDNRIQVHIESDGCIGRPNFVRYLEHVQAKITLTSSRRGEIQLYLISPFGTRSTLLAKRTRDTSQEGFNDWAFMSTHNWGELSMGRWTLEIENGASSSEIKTWTLVLHGTAAHPQSGKSAPYLVDKVCKAGQYYLHKFCYDECPANFFGTTEIIQVMQNGTNVTTSKPVLVCKSCTAFCLKCRGHAVFECVECANGYELSPQSMCVRKYVWNFVDKDLLSFLLIAVGFCLATVVLFFLLFCILQMRANGNCCFKKRNGEGKSQANGVPLADKQKLLESDSDEDEVIFMDSKGLSNNHDGEKIPLDH